MALDQITSQAIAPNAISVDNVANGSITASKLHDTAIADKLGYTPASAATVATQINDLIAGAPTALNTLNELAASLGNDSNYAATITTALAAKASITYVNSQISAIQVTPTQVSDKVNSSTGYFALPAGTTAQRPSSPTSNMIRKNTSTGYIEYYDSSTSQWIGLGAFQATGGSESTYSANGFDYKVHTFTSSSAFVVTTGAKSIDYLIIAAGGGGGPIGGGGGAGGFISGSITSTAGTYNIVIGAGGNVGQGGSTQATNGGNTTALGLTAIGGGAGGYQSSTGGNGGLGGGGGGSVSSGTAGVGGGSARNSGGNGIVGDASRGGNGGANTGGGGGGCGWQTPSLGQQGGSGIVIIRYTI